VGGFEAKTFAGAKLESRRRAGRLEALSDYQPQSDGEDEGHDLREPMIEKQAAHFLDFGRAGAVRRAFS
jgi:hypothetical protein